MNKNVIKYLTVITIVFSGMLYTVNALAVESTNPGNRIRQGIREELREASPRGTASNPGSLHRFKDNKAIIINATLTAKNGTTLTVSKENKQYTVLTDSNTKLRRRFWGKAILDEFQVNDNLQIYGTWTDDTKTTIQAKLIRNTSIQKRFGVFFGTVQSLTSNGYVMTTIVRGNQTVTVGSTTKFVNRREQTITQSDIIVEHKVRVKGLWDNKNNTITEVTQVKDFSLPPFVTPTPKP